MILNFDEAFKILEIDPTDDKKKIKIAYSEMLKKYHPEEFPEIFMKTNEAYRVALEFEKADFDEVKSKNKMTEKNNENEEFFERVKKNFEENKEKSFIENFEDIFSDEKNESEFENIFSNKNNHVNKKTFEESEEFSNIFDEKKNLKKSISEWIERLKSLISSEKRPLTEYRKILREFHFNFDNLEKKQIKEIFQKSELYNYAWRNLTRIEIELLIYNLNSSDEIVDILGETWADSGKNENTSLNKIAKKISSENFLENEEGYEQFIQDYFNINVFKLFKKNVALYSYRDIEQVGNTFKFVFYKIKNEYIEINNYMKILGMGYKDGLEAKITVFIMFMFLSTIITLFFLDTNVAWNITVFGGIFFTIIDWLNIIYEKDFGWSMRCGFSNYLFILMTIIFLGRLIVIGNAEYDSSFSKFLLYFLLISQYLFINIILFIKMVTTTYVRYEKIKEFSKKILNVFVLKR